MVGISPARLSLSFFFLLSFQVLVITVVSDDDDDDEFAGSTRGTYIETSKWPNACLDCFVLRRQTLRRWSVHHRDDLFYAPSHKMTDARGSADFDLSILSDFTRIVEMEYIRVLLVCACSGTICVGHVFFCSVHIYALSLHSRKLL